MGLDQVDQGGCLNIANTQVEAASTTAQITGSARMEQNM